MKTLTALLLWVLSSVGGPAPLCELIYDDQPEMCAPPPPPEDEPETPIDAPAADRQVGTQSGARISNGF